MGLKRIRPFPSSRFDDSTRLAVDALWKWYDVAGSDRATREDAERIRSGAEPLRVSAAAWRQVSGHCLRLKVDPAPLADRLEATARLRYGDGPASGKEMAPFLDGLAGSFAGVFAAVAGQRGSWQRGAAGEFAQGLILLDFLYRAPEYARRGMALFCRDELRSAGVTVDMLAGAEAPRGYRTLAWKQSIRARDSLAGARTLIVELDFRQRLHCKRVWFRALEHLYLLDRRDFDVWKGRPLLSPAAHFRVGIQSIFGRTAFRSA